MKVSFNLRRNGVSFLLLNLFFVLVFSQCKEEMEDQSPVLYSVDEIVKQVPNDPLFESIQAFEVKRIRAEISTTEAERMERIEKFTELSKKNELTVDEQNYFATELGFADHHEYITYRNSMVNLLKKYQVDKLSEKDQASVGEQLSIKQLDAIKKSQAISPSDYNSSLFASRANTNPRPECMKCGWDYAQCMSGYTYFIAYVTTTTTQSMTVWTSLNQQYSWDSVIHVTGDIYLYVKTTTSGCLQSAQNCFATCNY